MADKRISQLIERVDIANNDVLPIVASGATTTNKVTVSTLQDWMQDNLDVGVTSVGITIGSTGTDVSVSGSPITSSGNITINLPTASATNRGLLSAADWVTFNSKQQAITLTTTGTSGAATLVSGTLNIPNYSTDLSGYVTLGTAQTITAQKTFTTSGSSDTMIISHGSGSGFALDVLKAGDGEAIRVTKTSGTGNAMTISGGNFEAGTIVKTGGTSSQFLKADGSVDSSSYALNSSLSLYLPLTGGTISGQLNVGSGNLRIAAEGASNITILRNFTGTAQGQSGFNHVGFNNSNNFYFTKNLNNGCILSFNNTAYRTYTFPDSDATIASTSNLAAYLPLAGGTLTGALNGTSATFSQGINVTGNGGFFNSANKFGLDHFSGASRFYSNGGNTSTKGGYEFHINSSDGSLDVIALGIASTGAAAFSSSVGVGGTNTDSLFTINGTAGTSHQRFREGSTTVGLVGGANGIITGHNGKLAVRAESGLVLSGSGNSPDCIIASGGAVTFSSSVTAAQFGVPDGGRLQSNGGTQSYYAPNSGASEIGYQTTLNFRAFNGNNPVSAMFMSSSGNVGIGTASPSTKLHIVGTTEMRLDSTSSGSIIQFWKDSNASFASSIGNSTPGGSVQNDLLFSTYNGSSWSEAMRITSGGFTKASNTGTYVNSTAPYHEIVSNQTAANVLIFTHTHSSDPYGPYVFFQNVAPNNSTNYFLSCGDNAGDKFTVRSNGGVVNFQANNVNLSDERTKKDIEPLESYWDKFKAIEIVKFKYKDQTHDDFNIGVIAQQVEAVAPEFVDVDGWETKPKLDEEGNEIISEEEPLKSIYTADLHHATIKVLQEAMAKIEKLETEIDSLKNQIK